MSHWRTCAVVVALAALATPAGCESSAELFADGQGAGDTSGAATLGEPCAAAAPCSGQLTCLTGERFPGGLCSTACAAVDGCPAGTACIATEGGVCLLTCESERACRAEYDCRAMQVLGEDRQARVCIHD